MTKKNYEAFAETIYNSWLSVPANIKDTDSLTENIRVIKVDAHNNAIEDLVRDLLPIFKADNPLFNEGRFLEACGL
ncbi:MAG: hypothetical protein ACHQ1D_01320 [Nitrososphaerales archaeon]